jgi:ketosteroid isomerase-like protein
MSQENVEIVRKVVDAFNRGDLQSFKAPFAPDSVIVPLRAEMENTIFRGRDAAEQFFAAANESWDSPQAGIEEVRDGGGWLLVLGSFRARGRASGAEINAKIGWIVRFGDGAITSFHIFADREQALEAAGLSE